MRKHSTAAVRGRAFFNDVLLPIIEFLCAIGGQFVFWTGDVSRVRLAGALGAGVSPASNLTTNANNLPQSLVTAYDKVFIESLKGNTPWLRVCSRRTLEANSGNKLQLFMYQNLAAPANPPVKQAEGTIGTGLTVTVVQNTASMGQYCDYMNVSDFGLATALDNVLEALGVQMAYRLAQIVNIICQNVADALSVTDSLVDDLSKNATATVTTTDITAAAQSLAGINALPMDNGRYLGVIHPFTVGDILSDKTNNSLVDVVKRTADGIEQLRELPSPDGDALPVIDWGGVSFFQSTFVHKTANYAGGTGTGLRTYVVGKDGVIAVSFGAKDFTQLDSGDRRNLQVWIRRLTEPTGYDPSRVIGGFSSFNAMFTATPPPDPVARVRYIDAVSAIA